jgi:hypothetical protein
LIVFFIYKASREALIISARDMDKNERRQYERNKTIPELESYEAIGDFWDTHSLADYWDQTEPADFEIDPDVRRRYLVAVDPGLLKQLQKIAPAARPGHRKPHQLIFSSAPAGNDSLKQTAFPSRVNSCHTVLKVWGTVVTPNLR